MRIGAHRINRFIFLFPERSSQERCMSPEKEGIDPLLQSQLTAFVDEVIEGG